MAYIHFEMFFRIKVELLCFLRTEFDPLCVTFSTYHENLIHSVEQKVSRKVNNSNIQRINVNNLCIYRI